MIAEVATSQWYLEFAIQTYSNWVVLKCMWRNAFIQHVSRWILFICSSNVSPWKWQHVFKRLREKPAVSPRYAKKIGNMNHDQLLNGSSISLQYLTDHENIEKTSDTAEEGIRYDNMNMRNQELQVIGSLLDAFHHRKSGFSCGVRSSQSSAVAGCGCLLL